MLSTEMLEGPQTRMRRLSLMSWRISSIRVWVLPVFFFLLVSHGVSFIGSLKGFSKTHAWRAVDEGYFAGCEGEPDGVLLGVVERRVDPLDLCELRVGC